MAEAVKAVALLDDQELVGSLLWRRRIGLVRAFYSEAHSSFAFACLRERSNQSSLSVLFYPI
jgi:hypothetical protein